MPTEDDEEVSSGVVDSPPSDDPVSEPSAVYTSSVLPEGSPMCPIGRKHFADNKANNVAVAYLERKRKRDSDTGTNSVHSLVGAVLSEQHESSASEFLLLHTGSKTPLEPEADNSLKADPSPKRTKVSQHAISTWKKDRQLLCKILRRRRLRMRFLFLLRYGNTFSLLFHPSHSDAFSASTRFQSLSHGESKRIFGLKIPATGCSKAGRS
jgi:hypothetical protein